jgi:YVTN family beta-propeller protein
MTNRSLQHLLKLTVVTSAAILALSARADLRQRTDDDRRGGEHGDDRQEHKGPLRLATGQYITPTFIDGAVQQYLNPGLTGYPNFVAGEAVRSQLSPDGTTLAIITAGQNSLYKPDGTVDTANSTQFIFLYNVEGANKAKPVLTQVLQQVNAHVGLVFSPDGNTLYAAGGNDDAVYVYTRSGSSFTAAAPIALGHFAPGATGSARNKGVGLSVQPNASGMDLSADGITLVVANNYNDSISVIDTASRHVRYEHDLRPFFANNEGTSGAAGGTFPFAVVVKGNGTAYVSSDRDREVVVVDVASPVAGHLIERIKLDGNALGMTLDESQSTLYVAQDNADQVAVIDTSTNRVTTKIDARAPAGMLPSRKYTGAATFAVTLSRDGNTLYAVNSGANSIAVIPLTGRKSDDRERPDPDRPRAARRHVQRRWLVDVHHQRQERHRPQPRPPGRQYGQHDEHHVPGWQCRGRSRRAGVERVPVPVGARVPRERARAELERPGGPYGAGREEQFLLRRAR